MGGPGRPSLAAGKGGTVLVAGSSSWCPTTATHGGCRLRGALFQEQELERWYRERGSGGVRLRSACSLVVFKNL